MLEKILKFLFAFFGIELPTEDLDNLTDEPAGVDRTEPDRSSSEAENESAEQETKNKPMANFNIAYDIVRKHEGGFQINPNDRGNYNSLGELVGTNKGIAAFVWEDEIGRPPTEADMRAITSADARGVFERRFWNRIKADLIFDQQVANIFFDGAVNHGVSRGTRLMQEVLGVAEDGIVGGQTLNAINMGNSVDIFTAYRNRREAFYREIAVTRPQNAVFLDGWLRRINSFVYQDTGTVNPPATGGGSNPLITIGLLIIAGVGIKKAFLG